MSNVEQDRNGEKMQKHVPKWKKLLSLKNSSSAALLEHSSRTEESEKIKKLRNKEPHIDNSFKIVEKKRKKDKSKDEVSKEGRKKTKKDIHRKKKQKVNYEKINGKDDDRNESEHLSIQLPLEKNLIDDSIIEQTNLKIPEEFTHTVKAGLNYLIMWRYHKEKWKFQKSRQIWLLKNAYNEDLLSEDFFKLFLDYITELLGQSRDRTFKIAQDVINKLESEQKDDKITGQEDNNEKRKEQIKLNRAKAVVRVLS